MMPNALNRVVLLMTVSLGFLLLSACGIDQGEPVRETVARPAKLLTLEPASDVQTSRYPAVVNATRFSELSFQVGGLIEQVAVIKAQEVEEGDLIASIEQRDFRNQLASARSQFVNAEEEYARALKLAEQSAVARSVLDQRKADRDVAKASLDSAEKALDDTMLRAPFAGIIAEVPAREQETVASGQLIATLMDAGRLEVSIDLPARVVAESQEVDDRGAVVFMKAAPDLRIPAVFKEANLLADTVSQTYAITFTFEPPEGMIILPGMNATVELSTARRSDTLATNRISVPLTSLANDGVSSYVWVVDENTMIVSRREVTIEEGIGEYAVVTEGLGAGETIVTAGASFIAEGMQVRPWTE